MRPARPRRRSPQPFRGETAAARIVREHAAISGADPRRLAAALYEEAARLLDGAADGPPPNVAAQLARNALALFPVSRDEAAAGAITPEWLEDLHRLSRPNADHKRHGRWYTARPIAHYMARRAMAAADDADAPDALTALDPACGCGALLTPMFEAMVARYRRRRPEAAPAEAVSAALGGIIAADVDARAVETAVRRLRYAAERLAGGPVEAAPRTFVGDTLTAPPERLAPGGADVVVMNPPYLGNRYFAALPDPHAARAALREAFGWNDDLYAHFLERAWEWMRPAGVLCAITSDTFLAIPSKARTRETLRRRRLLEIVRVPPSAFAASVGTCITVATHRAPDPDGCVAYLDARAAPETAWDAMETDPPPPAVERHTVPASAWMDQNTPFYRPTPRAVAMFRRYLSGEPEGMVSLGDVAPARDCGINSGNVRHRLFFADHADGREMLIQGRQLERFRVRWDSPAARYRWVDIAFQPDPSRPGIGRGGKPSAHGETWGFRGDTRIFRAPERIFLRQTEDDLFAAYLRQNPDTPTYTDNTVFTLVLNDRGRELGLTYPYLLALLNSAFLNALYHALSQERGRAQAQVKVGYVNRLPIAIPTPAQRLAIERCAHRAMDEAEAGRPLTAIQWQLDTLVDTLYEAHSLPPDPVREGR